MKDNRRVIEKSHTRYCTDCRYYNLSVNDSPCFKCLEAPVKKKPYYVPAEEGKEVNNNVI